MLHTVDRFQPHRVEWTPERIRRMWDHYSSSGATTEDYFSYHSGRSIIRVAERLIQLRSRRVLDYGCGPGHLMRHLLDRGVACAGVEFTQGSVEAALANVGAHPLARGITYASGLPTPLADGSQDIVFAVEVVEHLGDEVLDATIGEIRRLLVPRGHVVVTTPNDEDLLASTFLCPECGARFHRWQHVRSFDVQSLVNRMENAGFRTVSCRATTFGDLALVSRAAHAVRRLARRLPRSPHLYYIGTT